MRSRMLDQEKDCEGLQRVKEELNSEVKKLRDTVSGLKDQVVMKTEDMEQEQQEKERINKQFEEG